MTISVDPIDPTGAVSELAGLLLAERDMSELLPDIVHLAQRRIDGAEEASITLIRHKKAGTVASTGPLALALDELQYETGYGPCLDAGRSNEVMHVTDAAREGRWPRYIPLARQNGLGSSLSIPLPVENYLVGALNLYSRTAASFSDEIVTLGEALSAHLTAALTSAESAQRHRERADNLAKAMESRAVIEQAKGMIMVQRKCTSSDAFDLLRQHSMEQNMKLRDMAASIVAGGSGHPVRLEASRID
jgi:GAF domain-containing protein